MPSRQTKFWRGLAVLLLCAAWAVAAHYASAGHGPADFNTALGCLPLVFIAAVVARSLNWFWRGLSLATGQRDARRAKKSGGGRSAPATPDDS